MMPKLFTVYRMKDICITILFGGSVKRCATVCGNRFRYLSNSKSTQNMECMRCGYKYHTEVATFNERYYEQGPDLSTKDPNFLFQTRKLL